MIKPNPTNRLGHRPEAKNLTRLLIPALLAWSGALIPGGAGPAYPLKVASGNHYLVDQNNRPFFVQGDSPWYLVQRLNASDVDYYLSTRAAQGYNSIILDLQSHVFGSGGGTYPQADVYGHLPFTGTIAGGAYTNLLSVNPFYYTNADYVIQRAGYYGINVFLYPLYDGSGGGSQGWYADMVGNGTSALYQFGQFVGNRYKSFPNIVYVGAGDYNEPNAPNYLWNAVASGIQSVDPNHAFTAHPARTYSALSYYSNSWVTLNSSYPTSLTYPYSLANYQRLPVAPSFMREAYYEGTVSAWTCRQEAWGAVLNGDAGHCYGNDSLWQFNVGWQNLLQSSGATTIANIIRLMNTRPWYNCVPDANHLGIVSGYGAWGSTAYVSVMREATGKTILAYIPQDSLTPTVNLTQISGSSANAWWYDPRTGAASAIGNYNTSGTATFTPPDANDWVLVLDDASQNFGIPGQQSSSAPPSSAPTVTLTASPATISSGQGTTLAWTSANATSVTWVGYGPVSLNGSAGVWPTTTTTYTVTATGPGGTVSASTTVTVSGVSVAAPPTATLSASPTTIASGQSSSLSWNTANASSVTLTGVGTVASSGTVSVAPSSTTTYTLTATGSGGTTSANATVTVSAASAPTVTLIATPATITSGQGSTLAWTSANATSVTWVGYGPVSLNGNAGVWPNTTTTYTVTATGPGGTTSASATITVDATAAVASPGIAPTVTLTATPSTVSSGQGTTLAWTSANATSVTWVGVGSVSLNGNAGVWPNATTTYTVTATGPGGTSSASATVTVTGTTIAASPPTVTLTATPSTINLGQGATLTWTSANATSLTWNGVGPVSLNGNAGVWPSATTTYTVTATGPGGTTSASATVTVTGSSTPSSTTPPPSVTLTATPATIASGQSTTLAWTSANATSVTWVGFGPVSLNGNAGVWPSTTTTYVVTATGPGGTTSASATVTVSSASPPSVTLTATPATISSGQATTLAWTSANATGVTWVGVGPVSLNGNAGVWPAATTTYTVTATGPGGTTSASATVTVTGGALASWRAGDAATPPIQGRPIGTIMLLERSSIAGHSQFEVSFTAQPGQNYAIQASADLQDWLTLGTMTAASANVTFIDATPSAESCRFYRVIQPTPGPAANQ